MKIKSRQKSNTGANARELIGVVLLIPGLTGAIWAMAADSELRVVPVLTPADLLAK